MLRFMRAYRELLDWMYSDPLAVKYYAETIKQPESLVVMQRDQYNPKEALSPDRLSDIDQVMADAIEMKFLEAPLTKEQLAEFFQIPPPGSDLVHPAGVARAGIRNPGSLHGERPDCHAASTVSTAFR